MTSFEIKNKRIIAFYEKHPTVNFEAVNIIFVEMFEKLFSDMNTTINHSVNTEILHSLTELKTHLSELKSDLPNSISLKFHEFKRDYLEEMKNIVSHNLSQNKDGMHTLLNQLHTNFVDKTKLLLTESLPKSNELIKKEIADFELSMHEEFKKLDATKSSSDVSLALNNFESKFNSLLLNVSNATESRLTEKLNYQHSIHDTFRTEISQVMSSVSKSMNEQQDFFDKYKNSSSKGNLSENNLEYVLSQLYQSAEIHNTSKETASCDFLLRRPNMPPILIENKDYSRNVPLDEVKKFHRDIETQNCHGIFLSQQSGITSKQNYQIEFIGRNVLVYVHNVQYQKQIIKIAVDLIDHLSPKVLELSDDKDIDKTHHSISQDTIDEINKEIHRFQERRRSITDLLKDFNAKMLKELNMIEFPSLAKFITGKGGVVVNDQTAIICDVCNSFTAHSNKSLAAHKRKCKTTVK
jgi:hypothetical protein